MWLVDNERLKEGVVLPTRYAPIRIEGKRIEHGTQVKDSGDIQGRYTVEVQECELGAMLREELDNVWEVLAVVYEVEAEKLQGRKMPRNGLVDEVLKRSSQRQVLQGRECELEISGSPKAYLFRRRTIEFNLSSLKSGEALEHVDEFCERLGGYVDLKDAQRMWYGSTQGIGNGGKGNGEWPVDNKYLQLWAVPYDGHQRILNDFQSRPGSGA